MSLPLVRSQQHHAGRHFAPLLGSRSVGCAAGGDAEQPRFEFCGKPATFTPIYSDSPAGNTASVNAGDHGLYVGGGAINRAFAAGLGLQEPNDYQQLHKEMLAAARAKPGQLISAADRSEAAGAAMGNLGLLGCFARVLGGGATDRGAVGAAFVDVFAEGQRPLSPKNVAMLYVVGPMGHGAPKKAGRRPAVGDKAAFLQAVQEMAENAMLAVAEYNALAAGAELPQLEVVQFCLVSGGVFRHRDSSKVEVAAATVQGLRSGALAAAAAGNAKLPVVRFGYDEGAFEDAVDMLTSPRAAL